MCPQMRSAEDRHRTTAPPPDPTCEIDPESRGAVPLERRTALWKAYCSGEKSGKKSKAGQRHATFGPKVVSILDWLAIRPLVIRANSATALHSRKATPLLDSDEYGLWLIVPSSPMRDVNEDKIASDGSHGVGDADFASPSGASRYERSHTK